jgi:hypothetical protein
LNIRLLVEVVHRQADLESFLKACDTGAATMQLLRDSWNISRDLSLRDWADDVLDMLSTRMKLSRLYYSRLAFSLFSFLHQVPEQIAKYGSMASV